MDAVAPLAKGVDRSVGRSLSPWSFLLMAIWLGLIVGSIDLIVIVAKKSFLNREGAHRAARDFLWTVPVGHVVLSLIVATVLLTAGWLKPSRVTLRIRSWVLATLCLWAALARMPIYLAAALFLAGVVGLLFSDAVIQFGFNLRLGWVRKSLTALIALLILAFASTTGRHWYREHRAVAALPAPAAQARNILFIVWDTVRASDLSLYGYARNTTPNLKRWAQNGVRYNRALAPSPWTYPSHSCFFTGQWPFKLNSQWKFSLDTPDPTLAEFLASRGYQTAGFVANTNCCNYETGLDRGFIHFEDYQLTARSLLDRTVPGRWFLEQFFRLFDPYERKWVNLQSRGASEINDTFLDWLGHERSDRPFFAFLNYFDAHEPFIPPRDFVGNFGVGPTSVEGYQFLVDFVGLDKRGISQVGFDMVRNSYDDCISFLDDQLGRLLDDLDRRGILRNTVVVIASDHGEAFGDHGIFGHSYSVNLEEVSVPLVILSPDAPKGRSVHSAVSLRDLPATIVDQLGIAKGSPFPGRSLAEYWKAPINQAMPEMTSYALSEQATEVALHNKPGEGGFEMSLVALGGYQYIRTGTGTELLFNLWTDPATQHDLMRTPKGKEMAVTFRRLLLKALTENRGSAEVEKAYLNDFRRKLAELIAQDDDASRMTVGGG